MICGIWLVSDYFHPQSNQNPDESKVIPATTIKQTIQAQNISLKFQSSTNDYFTIDAQVSETPRFVQLYKGTLSEDDQKRYYKFQSDNWTKRKANTPSKTEAPDLAIKALDAYGGLTSDAYLSGVYISESITQTSSGEITERHPIMTQVFFKRKINGMQVTGERDVISVDLGENGEVLAVMKRWRTLEKTSDVVQVITPDKAVEKLKNGDTYMRLQSPSNVRIDDVQLGYYEKPGKIPEIILEPVWIFKNSNDPVYEFPVYARQFAAFDQTPAVTRKSVAGKTVSEKDPFTVKFTDSSDANPSKWQWDFGDGTTSTEQNPTHKYKSAGTYNITLTVWNDMGSDTMTQQYIVEDAGGNLTGEKQQ
ncbi:PKD domain-containing protein [Methanoregula sp. PtaB.Bin085]|nr:PKD domain-containing protein [Methanoregula sp. PtaB.Bin085]